MSSSRGKKRCKPEGAIYRGPTGQDETRREDEGRGGRNERGLKAAPDKNHRGVPIFARHFFDCCCFVTLPAASFLVARLLFAPAVHGMVNCDARRGKTSRPFPAPST